MTCDGFLYVRVRTIYIAVGMMHEDKSTERILLIFVRIHCFLIFFEEQAFYVDPDILLHRH